MGEIIRAPWQIELKSYIGAYDDTYVHTQYQALATDDEIAAFLEAEPLWDSAAMEWTTVAKAPNLEKLRASVCDVINSIISTMGKAPDDGFVTREAHTTLHHPLAHRERNEWLRGGNPAIVVRATGPSFEDQHTTAERRSLALLAYSNLATYIDVGRECAMTSDDERNVLNSSVHARCALNLCSKTLEI